MILLPFAINQIDVDAHASNRMYVCEYQIIASSFQQPVRFHLQQPRPGSVVSMETGRTPSASLMQLYELSKLGPNWDAYGAESINAACVANVETILLALADSTPSPEITPNPNGTLSLDWESDHQALSLEIGVARYSSFWESLNGLKTNEGVLTAALPDFIATALANLFPQAAPVFPSYEELTFDAEGQSGRLAAGYIG